MSKKRTKIEIIKDIIETVKENRKCRITRLIYKANLSNNSLKPYINELLVKGFLKEIEENGKRFFIMTEKGQEFLNEFEKIKIFTEAYGLSSES